MVKIDDIIGGIECSSEESTSYLDLQTGKVEHVHEDMVHDMEDEEDEDAEEDSLPVPEWRKSAIDIARLIATDDDGRFVKLPGQFDVHEWRMMADFAEDQQEDRVRDDLNRACHGGGAFRCFKDAVYRLGIEKRWFAYRDECYRKFAIAWCQAREIAWE